MNPDIAGGLVLIAVGVGCFAGVWLGIAYGRTTHLCFACRMMPDDVKARIKEAVDREWLERWGRE